MDLRASEWVTRAVVMMASYWSCHRQVEVTHPTASETLEIRDLVHTQARNEGPGGSAVNAMALGAKKQRAEA